MREAPGTQRGEGPEGADWADFGGQDITQLVFKAERISWRLSPHTHTPERCELGKPSRYRGVGMYL